MLPQPDAKPRLLPGQTLIFIGDHTSPDERGYIDVISGVLARFHPEMDLNLISAGSRGQTAHGLRSQGMMNILTSSHPDWIVVGIGLVEALREPAALDLLRQYQESASQNEQVIENTFGPEFHPHIHDYEPSSDVGPEPDLSLEHIETFHADLRGAISRLASANVRSVLLTTVVLGSDRVHLVNAVLKRYNKVIREVAREEGMPLVDVERAFRDFFDRADNYKQRVSLTGPDGKLNAQGQALLARTFLNTFGLLPLPGFRPSGR